MSQTERKTIKVSLPQELQAKLSFRPDDENKWLIDDEMTRVGGGPDLFEYLPTRIRVSMDGSRVEFGARCEDLEALLALARTVIPKVGSVNRIRDFWKDHWKFSSQEEGDWIFIGENIEPTTDAFEREYSRLNFAYDAAIAAAIHDKSYKGLVRRKRERKIIRAAEEENRAGRSMIFVNLMKNVEKAQEEYRECPVDPETIVTAEALRDFPLRSYKTSINFAPGELTLNGSKTRFGNITVVAYNGRPEVFIRASNDHYDWKKEKWLSHSIRVTLPIPSDNPIETVTDLEGLTIAIVEIETPQGKIKRELVVDIKVEDDSFVLETRDDHFALQVEKPICDGCKIPVWKFPYRTAPYIAGTDSGPFYQTNMSLGIIRHLVDSDEGRRTYCPDCIPAIVDQYLEAHPFASHERARNILRRRLDEMGYNQVQMYRDDIYGWGNLWVADTIIEYQRGRRMIARYCGSVRLNHDGKFESKLFPLEYVNFRA